MRAITLWQPWASLCVIPRPCVCWAGDGSHYNAGPLVSCRICDNTGEREPFKTIETRSWKAPDSLIGRRIAIHAAKRRFSFGGPEAEMLRSLPLATYSAIVDALPGRDIEIGDNWPLGTVVGTAVLADCVPMESLAPGDPEPDTLDWGRVLYILPDRDELRLVDRFTGIDPFELWGEDRTDQLPFGHFEQGRWAWLLTDAERFAEPIPATGRQGIWTWEGPA